MKADATAATRVNHPIGAVDARRESQSRDQLSVSEHTMRATTIFASIACAALLPSARADFLGFGSTSYVVEGELDTYHIVEVHALFDDPTDRLLNIFEVRAAIGNVGIPSTKTVFFQAADGEDYPASFLPMPFLPPGEQWLFDSYVTIGAEQGNHLNGTIADPDFVDSTFIENSMILDAGWYNIPPTNPFGLAGSSRKVFLGQFVLTREHFVPGVRLEFSATIGFANSGVLEFAAHAKNFYFPSGTSVPYIADRIDDDAISDVVFVNPQTRRISTWLMQGLGRKQATVFPDMIPSGFRCEGTGDLNGDGCLDVIWRDINTGRFHAWMLNGMTLAESDPISDPIGSNWSVVGIGDISGDGRGDIVLRDSINGTVEAWLMDGLVTIAAATVGTAVGVTSQGMGDFDGDGMYDILWRTPYGAMSAWILQGLALKSEGALENCNPVISPAWTVAAIGDINGDTRADIVWRHSSGAVHGWLMDARSRSSAAAMHAGVGLQWRIESLRDLNGDGKYDLIWRNQLSGDLNGWLMNGFARQSTGFIRNAPTQWALVDP